MDVGQPHAGVDGKIVDALFALLDQRVLVELPGELYGIAFALLQRLINGNGADRDRRVSKNPFARGVDIAARGEIHHGVGAPADRPHHLVDFFLDRRGHRGVSDIGVDFCQEIAADDHRLEFAMVDVAGDDGASARDFAAHEFRGDEGGHRGAEALAVGKGGFGAFELRLAAKIFAGGDVDHFLGDDPGAGEFELGDHVAVEPAQRLVMGVERFRRMRGADIAVVFRLDLAALIFLDAAALFHPFDARALQARIDVDGHSRIGVGAGSVIDRKIGLAGAFGKNDLAQRHTHVRRFVRRDEDLAGGGQGTRGDGGKRGVRIGADVHGVSSCEFLIGWSRHSGAMRSIEPGISRFRVWC